MTDLIAVRQHWTNAQPLYSDFIDILKADIARNLKLNGLFGEVSGRPKSLDSLLKKLLLRPDLTYEGMSDKAGLRIVVRYRSEIPHVEKVIASAYDVLKRDDKTADVEVDRLRYQGLHLDVRLANTNQSTERFAKLKAEIQIRTKPQNLWSELNHELAYKTNILLPADIKRRLLILLALLEMCDREFESVNRDISELPDARSLRFLFALERQFYKINPTNYSKELSIRVIDALSPLYSMTEGVFATHFEDFYRDRAAELEIVFREARGRSLFLSQPEVLMLFDLLERIPYALAEQWGKHLPASELEEVARIWGKPLH